MKAHKIFYIVSALSGSIFLSSCAATKNDNSIVTAYGSKMKLGKGYVQSYGVVEGKRNVKEIGVIISEKSLLGLPKDCGKDLPSEGSRWIICQAQDKNERGQMNDTMVLTLDMPKNVSKLAGIKKLDFSWLPYGHAPKGVWDKPQFDIHFPFVRPLGGKNSKLFYSPETSPDQLPNGFIVLPKSGFQWDTAALKGHSHAADPNNSPEFKGGKFNGNFLYLTYEGKAIGYEAYVSKSLLDKKGSFSKSLGTPENSYGSSIAPSSLTISYLNNTNEFKVTLSDYKKVNKK